MTIFTVSTTNDIVDGNYSQGQFSLREAVNLANGTTAADTIVFAPAIEGQALVLTGGELLLSHDTTIDGDQNNDGREVALSGGGASRILHIIGGDTDAVLRDLTLTGGWTTGDGGAIRADDLTTLTLDQATVSGNSAFLNGGGIGSDSGTVTLINSTVTGNGTAGDGDATHGGGISSGSGAVTLINSTVTGNSAATYDLGLGGGIGSHSGAVTLINSTVSGNSSYPAFPG